MSRLSHKTRGGKAQAGPPLLLRSERVRYRKWDGLSVSEIGLGTWQLGADWGRVDDATAEAILLEAVEHGVNFFDTADVYGRGLSETRIARFLDRHPQPVTVATKLGRFPEPGGEANWSLARFREHTEQSLRRLKRESLDLTQVHCLPTEVLRRGEVFEWLRTLQREGKIQRFGLSVESMEEAHLCLEQEGVASLQIIFNLFRQKPARDLFEHAKEKQVALIVRLPLASGLLSGRFTLDTAFPDDDHRNYNRDGAQFNVGETFAGLPFADGVRLADALKACVPEAMTLEQMALRWILDFDAVTVVIPGATRPDQVRKNCSVSDLAPLSSDQHTRLESFYAENVAPHIRGKY